MTDRRPIPDRLLRIAGSLVPNADLGEARLAGGQFHDVVLLPGVAAVRVARRPAAAAELSRRTARRRRRGRAGLPGMVAEPHTEVSILDGSTPALAVSWLEGAPGQRGVGDPAQIRRLIDALAAVDLSDLAPCSGRHTPTVARSTGRR